MKRWNSWCQLAPKSRVFEVLYLFIIFIGIYKKGPEIICMEIRETVQMKWSHIYWVTKTQFMNFLWHKFSGKKWLQTLTVHSEFIAISRIKNLNSTVWVDFLHNVRSWPPGFQFTREEVESWVVQQNLLSWDKKNFGEWIYHERAWFCVLLSERCHMPHFSALLARIFAISSRAPALSKSKFSCFIAHIARCSNSTGKWQGFPNTTQYGDILRTVL